MKDDLQAKLVEILSSIQAATGKASDFALEQLPDIAQSYIVYGRAMSVATLIFCIMLCVASAIGIRKVCSHAGKHEDLLDCNPVAITFGGGGSVVGLLVGIFSLYDALKFGALVWLAPKVWLLKEIATLIN